MLQPNPMEIVSVCQRQSSCTFLCTLILDFVFHFSGIQIPQDLQGLDPLETFLVTQ